MSSGRREREGSPLTSIQQAVLHFHSFKGLIDCAGTCPKQPGIIKLVCEKVKE